MTTVLVIDHSPDALETINGLLPDASPRGEHLALRVDLARDLGEGLARIAAGGVDLVLLELALPDSHGVETLRRLQDHAPEVPVVVLSVIDDERLALEAVRAGAWDYLVRTRVTGAALRRVIRYTVERHRVMGSLRDQALRDPLTGLHNRRGFDALAEQILLAAQRSGRGLVLLYVDVDGMKGLNDAFGHAAGDRVLLDAAALLRSTFRASDVVARIGGDEFAVLAIDAPPGAVEQLAQRLRDRLVERNMGAPSAAIPLSLSVGVAALDADRTETVRDLLAAADRAMYAQKRLTRVAGRA